MIMRSRVKLEISMDIEKHHSLHDIVGYLMDAIRFYKDRFSPEFPLADLAPENLTIAHYHTKFITTKDNPYKIITVVGAKPEWQAKKENGRRKKMHTSLLVGSKE